MTSTLWRPPPLGPGGRPFRGWRLVPFLLSLGAFAANVLILLSDRAPGLFSRLSARIDAGVSIAAGATGVATPGKVPQSDFNVHFAIWAVAALLLGLATWSWPSLAVAGAAVFTSSVLLELAQRTFTETRTVQRSDVVANAIGVACGVSAVALFAVIWWALNTRRFAPRR